MLKKALEEVERVWRWGARRHPPLEHVAPTPGSFRVEESTAKAFGQEHGGCDAVRRRLLPSWLL